MKISIVNAVVTIALSGYLIGAINFGIIFTYIFVKKDIRTMGSGNAGMTNVLRSVGFVPGVLTGVFDFAKGIGAVLLGSWLFTLAGGEPYVGKCLAAACVLVGNLYPVFFGFKGGKGVMTSAGILVVLNPWLLLICAVVFGISFIITRIVSLSVLIGVSVLPVCTGIICYLAEQEIFFTTLFTTMITVMLFLTLGDNIKRLRAGTEKKLIIKSFFGTKKTRAEKASYYY